MFETFFPLIWLVQKQIWRRYIQRTATEYNSGTQYTTKGTKGALVFWGLKVKCWLSADYSLRHPMTPWPGLHNGSLWGQWPCSLPESQLCLATPISTNYILVYFIKGGNRLLENNGRSYVHHQIFRGFLLTLKLRYDSSRSRSSLCCKHLISFQPHHPEPHRDSLIQQMLCKNCHRPGMSRGDRSAPLLLQSCEVFTSVPGDSSVHSITSTLYVLSSQQATGRTCQMEDQFKSKPKLQSTCSSSSWVQPGTDGCWWTVSGGFSIFLNLVRTKHCVRSWGGSFNSALQKALLSLKPVEGVGTLERVIKPTISNSWDPDSSTEGVKPKVATDQWSMDRWKCRFPCVVNHKLTGGVERMTWDTRRWRWGGGWVEEGISVSTSLTGLFYT